MFYLFYSLILILVILGIFSSLGKSNSVESLSTSVFECGFTSYHFSRFSFSIHYFTVGIIFLFLDLELCYLMPFFNSSFSEFKFMSLFWIFISTLVLGLLSEWRHGMLDWKS